MNKRRLTVAIVLPELGGGGAERTFLNILNHLDRSRFKPVLVLYRRSGSYLTLLREDVSVVSMGSSRTRRSVVPLARWIRSERPDVVMSTLLHINVATVAAMKLSGCKIPVVVRESNHLTAAGRPIRSLSGCMMRWAYRHADSVVALSHGVRKDVIARYGLDEDRVQMIHNPIDISDIQKRADEEAVPLKGWTDTVDPFKLVAVGRLVPQKGFDLLIKAASRLPLPWTLLILGEGSEKKRLRGLAAELGVSDRVHFPGFIQNHFPYVAMADLFVLSSRWEGFGHVIAEAMACGTPVLSTCCPSGPDEIIQHGVDGELCDPNSAEALTQHIENLLRSPETRLKYVEAAAKSVCRFDAPAVAGRYGALFTELTGTS